MTQAVIQTTVTGMQGRPISTTVPVANQAYTWSGSAWTPTGPFLPLAGGVVTGALRIQYAAPVQIFNDTGTSITAGGLWRESNSGGNFFIQSNTATAGDFSTSTTPLALNANGSATIGNNLAVNGALNISGTTTFGGNIVAATSGSFIQNLQITQPGVPGLGSGYSLLIDGSNNRIFNLANGSVWVWSAANAELSLTLQNGLWGIMYPGGNLGISGTLTQGSDQTNKTNISTLSQGISLVRQLIPKAFAWNSTPNTMQWGFIAQDVEGVIPPAVSATNEPSGGTMLSLDTTAILAAVTMAVKQLDQRCTALEAHDGITPSAGELA